MTIVKTETSSRRMDAGRLVMVPLCTLMLTADAIILTQSIGPGFAGVLRWISNALVGAFYVLIIWAYLRRGPAKATTTSVVARTAAVTGTLTPFVFPMLPNGTVSMSRELVADVFLVTGTVWSLWSLRTLGKNLSIIAQAREVVEHGPYRWIRHPLYTGEIVSSLGLAIAVGTVPAVAVWCTLVALQVYRARQEEQILITTLPPYASYRARTAALLPGVF